MKITYIDEPNLTLPLAASYNTRGQDGFTQAITNNADQRKVNSIYEPIKNEMTDKTTLYLAKRPGVSTKSICGDAGQTAYLLDVEAGAYGTWVFNVVSTSTSRVSSSTSTVTVTSLAGYAPVYVDKTLISGIDTAVLQIRNAAGLQKVYYTSTIAAWTEISSAVFTGLSHQGKLEHMDGYGFIATRSPSRIYNADLNSLAIWNPASYITRRTQQDTATGLARLGSQIISFGSATFEVYVNAGTSVFSPLVAMPELSQDFGLLDQSAVGTRHYYAVLGGWLFWVSDNPVAVYAYNGQRVEKVSNLAIDKILAARTSFSVSKLAFRGQVAIAICLDAVTSTPQRALLFFPEWRDWFEWHSTVFIPQTGLRTPNLYLGVGALQHHVYEVVAGTANWLDEGVAYTMTHQFKLPTNGNARQQLRMFGVKGDTAASTTTSALNVRFSFDDWQTSTAARPIDLTKGKKHIYRCGGFSDVGVYLDHTANLDCRLEAVVARIE